jgi:hypothetical protein
MSTITSRIVSVLFEVDLKMNLPLCPQVKFFGSDVGVELWQPAEETL